MQKLKAAIAVALSILIPAETVQATSFGSSSAATAFCVNVPKSLGYVTDEYAPNSDSSPVPRPSSPDVILIQDLHVNRSVQFAISGILKRLKEQGLLQDAIAVEGATGPVDVAEMQRFADPVIRKDASDYLVKQGEMPGAMHFAVTDGSAKLFGIETDEFYRANLDMFRRSYPGRSELRGELEKIQTVLPKLERDPATRENARILEKDLTAVSALINNQTIPQELPATLRQATEAVDHLKLVLPNKDLVAPLSASVNFYALALLRDEELFKNAMALRELGRQKITIVVAGGFHTPGLTEQCKQKGLSYVVITPAVRRNDQIDQKLYVERLLDHHLTPDQVEQGLDWASMDKIQPTFRSADLFSSAVANVIRSRRHPILTSATMGLMLLNPFQTSSPTRQATPTESKSDEPKPVLQIPLAEMDSKGHEQQANLTIEMAEKILSSDWLGLEIRPTHGSDVDRAQSLRFVLLRDTRPENGFFSQVTAYVLKGKKTIKNDWFGFRPWPSKAVTRAKIQNEGGTIKIAIPVPEVRESTQQGIRQGGISKNFEFKVLAEDAAGKPIPIAVTVSVYTQPKKETRPGPSILTALARIGMAGLASLVLISGASAATGITESSGLDSHSYLETGVWLFATLFLGLGLKDVVRSRATDFKGFDFALDYVIDNVLSFKVKRLEHVSYAELSGMVLGGLVLPFSVWSIILWNALGASIPIFISIPIILISTVLLTAVSLSPLFPVGALAGSLGGLLGIISYYLMKIVSWPIFKITSGTSPLNLQTLSMAVLATLLLAPGASAANRLTSYLAPDTDLGKTAGVAALSALGILAALVIGLILYWRYRREPDARVPPRTFDRDILEGTHTFELVDIALEILAHAHMHGSIFREYLNSVFQPLIKQLRSAQGQRPDYFFTRRDLINALMSLKMGDHWPVAVEVPADKVADLVNRTGTKDVLMGPTDFKNYHATLLSDDRLILKMISNSELKSRSSPKPKPVETSFASLWPGARELTRKAFRDLVISDVQAKTSDREILHRYVLSGAWDSLDRPKTIREVYEIAKGSWLDKVKYADYKFYELPSGRLLIARPGASNEPDAALLTVVEQNSLVRALADAFDQPSLTWARIFIDGGLTSQDVRRKGLNARTVWQIVIDKLGSFVAHSDVFPKFETSEAKKIQLYLHSDKPNAWKYISVTPVSESGAWNARFVGGAAPIRAPSGVIYLKKMLAQNYKDSGWGFWRSRRAFENDLIAPEGPGFHVTASVETIEWIRKTIIQDLKDSGPSSQKDIFQDVYDQLIDMDEELADMLFELKPFLQEPGDTKIEAIQKAIGTIPHFERRKATGDLFILALLGIDDFGDQSGDAPTTGAVAGMRAGTYAFEDYLKEHETYTKEMALREKDPAAEVRAFQAFARLREAKVDQAPRDEWNQGDYHDLVVFLEEGVINRTLPQTREEFYAHPRYLDSRNHLLGIHLIANEGDFVVGIDRVPVKPAHFEAFFSTYAKVASAMWEEAASISAQLDEGGFVTPLAREVALKKLDFIGRVREANIFAHRAVNNAPKPAAVNLMRRAGQASIESLAIESEIPLGPHHAIMPVSGTDWTVTVNKMIVDPDATGFAQTDITLTHPGLELRTVHIQRTIQESAEEIALMVADHIRAFINKEHRDASQIAILTLVNGMSQGDGPSWVSAALPKIAAAALLGLLLAPISSAAGPGDFSTHSPLSLLTLLGALAAAVGVALNATYATIRGLESLLARVGERRALYNSLRVKLAGITLGIQNGAAAIFVVPADFLLGGEDRKRAALKLAELQAMASAA